MDDKEATLSETKRELTQWIEQTKRLLLTLPACLDELDRLRADAAQARQRVGELEQESGELRRSRDDLAEILVKLRELIAEQLTDHRLASVAKPAPAGAASTSAFEAAKQRPAAAPPLKVG